MRAHPLLIVWRLLWIGPVTLARILLCLLACVGWGGSTANYLWQRTR
jgi:hypothetical protein